MKVKTFLLMSHTLAIFSILTNQTLVRYLILLLEGAILLYTFLNKLLQNCMYIYEPNLDL